MRLWIPAERGVAPYTRAQGWPRRAEAWSHASRLAEAQESAPHASRLRRLGFCIVSSEQEGYKSVPEHGFEPIFFTVCNLLAELSMPVRSTG
jgi:hypothetical protein